MSVGDQPNRQGALRGPLWLFRHAETLVNAAVAVVLVVIAVAALVHTVTHLTLAGPRFLTKIVDAINGVLLVVIVLEILRTVLAHFTQEGFPIHDFLVIGIISATRHILTVTVRLTVSQGTRAAVTLSLLELLASAGVVLALVVSLYVVARTDISEKP
jgi:uncharacterized membrane protein (DUF373 family)